ncbi:MAG TPA: CHAD domain-containing protein [Beijerinckiaceae bacterium]|jgi:inorganic triphosphatase YgiF
MTTPPHEREIELKLELDPAEVDRLLAHPILADQPFKVVPLVSTYYDTPGFDLRERDLTLRVRTEGEQRVQTVKAGGSGAGLFDRGEWERDLDGADEPDLSAVAETPLGPLLDEAGRKFQLAPVFRVRVERRTLLLERSGSAVELVLDRGTVEAGERSTPLCEVELELKKGDPAAVFALAQELGSEVPLHLGLLAKSARGYALVDPRPAKPVKAKDPVLNPADPAVAAVQAFARACLAQIAANERVIVETRAPEGVHQMRVGLRRLRAMLTVFKDVVADGELERLKGDLRALGLALGEARDLDVLIEGALADAHRRKPESRTLQALSSAIERRRDAAYGRMLANFASPPHRALMLRLVTWIETGAWTRTEGGPTIAEVATNVLDRRFKRVRRRAKDLADLDPEARHEVRIEAKKLRYAASFVASLATGEKALKRQAKFLKAIERLQEHLGALNDIATLEHLEASFPDDPTARKAARRLVKRQKKGEEKELACAAEAAEALAEAKPFWR